MLRELLGLLLNESQHDQEGKNTKTEGKPRF